MITEGRNSNFDVQLNENNLNIWESINKSQIPAVRNGEFNPGGSLYMDWQAYPYGSLPVGIKERDGENR